MKMIISSIKEESLKNVANHLNTTLRKFHKTREDRRWKIITGWNIYEDKVEFVSPKNQVLYTFERAA